MKEVLTCPICGHEQRGRDHAKMMKHVDTEHPYHCYCGELLKGHQLCSLCGIFIGPLHHEKKAIRVPLRNLINMKTNMKVVVCAYCFQLLEKNPNLCKDMPFLQKGLKEGVSAVYRTDKKRRYRSEPS